MTALENYANLINGIFGPGTATFDITSADRHNVTGALLDATNYSTFKANFTARLERLRDIYSTHPALLQKIIVQVNEISSIKNWQGAFAELAAFDHLNNEILNHPNFLLSPIEPDVTLPKFDSFALEMGKQETNLDGHIADCGYYFDVKVLKDNVTEILEGIYKEVKLVFPGIRNINAEYDMTISYGIIQQKRAQLKQEFIDALNAKPNLNNFRSQVVPDLSFVISHSAGVSFAIRTYDPYGHAEKHFKNVFIYTAKFLKKHPTFIVLVNFPWYNQVLNHKDNNIFERAYARRVFCQFIGDNTPFSSIEPKFTGGETVYEVSTYLSGIIFLTDDTILSDKPDETNVKCSVYLNPNAVNKTHRSYSSGYLQGICNVAYDDFEHDNY